MTGSGTSVSSSACEESLRHVPSDSHSTNMPNNRRFRRRQRRDVKGLKLTQSNSDSASKSLRSNRVDTNRSKGPGGSNCIVTVTRLGNNRDSDALLDSIHK